MKARRQYEDYLQDMLEARGVHGFSHGLFIKYVDWSNRSPPSKGIVVPLSNDL